MAASPPAPQAIGSGLAATGLIAALVVGTVAALPAAPARAQVAAVAPKPTALKLTAPKPTEAQLRAQLKRLNTKVDKLIEQYNLKRVELAKAQEAAGAAKERLAAADRTLATTEQRVAELARLRYQNGNPPVPGFMLDGASAAVLDQLTAEQQALVQNVAKARDEKKKAAAEAEALTDKIRDDAADVAEQRDEAEDVIDDIKEKLADLVPYAGGRTSNGTWAPELPAGADNITPRTRLMREQVRKNFALPFSVGCFRSGAGGEHPLGRACDFMMSTGGSMPTAANAALGDRLAAWALQNKDKLGVKYVIWKQRINSGSGWRPMSDRGSITENHYDHVHISMN
ncbi:coiled-coil domain-containing protein [Nonomuraea sp. NPDC050783]|uniref:coiled-coil domain-containing protein n=1 Tax=Nonomuraea sp. NPDC050783 TaxID=3154634 RepID=UPI003465B838